MACHCPEAAEKGTRGSGGGVGDGGLEVLLSAVGILSLNLWAQQ